MAYGLIVFVRNWLYNKKIFKSASFALPIICVGNLSVGGTGKSPMVEYLVQLLHNQFKVATLSRGYKRKTKGYALANSNTTALEIGDEPMQFHLKFPNVPVAVGEERIVAIPQLLHDKPETQVIILDDAFQHRTIHAGLNIVLTDFNNLFTRDFYLPTGDLRDSKSSYKRAEIIVVTKCKPELTFNERQKVIDEIDLVSNQHIFFTAINYQKIKHIFDNSVIELNNTIELLLVTGIANPKPLKKWIEDKVDCYNLLQYSDHHIFTIDDLNEIKKKFESIDNKNKIILTTEKDAVRFFKFNEQIAQLPFYVLPIEHQFLFNEGTKFDELITSFINNFNGTSS